MNIFAEFHAALGVALEALVAEGKLPPGLDLARAVVEPPRDPSHGDLSTNAALVLAKGAGTKPRDVAQMLAEKLAADPRVEKTEIAGPGFVNLRLNVSVWRELVRAILAAGTAYGSGKAGGGRPVNVEYVSANPTGPMHVGHCRGAVVGDALASLLDKTGFAVTREYYINDAGAQVDTLARSVHLRYREALGEQIGQIPEGYYPGEYLVPVGKDLAGKFGDMLGAVERHPAMLLYLDQAQSVGPNSPIGARVAARGVRKIGLNENLAREIMELHTLGVRTGYSQADVTEFARAMTGWTVSGLGRGVGARFTGTEGPAGAFVFAAPLHEPGGRTIMGKRYDQSGERQAQDEADAGGNSHFECQFGFGFMEDDFDPSP